MRAGAAIDELNCVRKHLSRIKGGRLAAAAGTTVTLALSDVHGPVADDPSVIGSGPTVADPTTFADAAAIVEKYRVELPAGVRDHLAAGLRGAAEETVKAGDPRIESSSYTVVGNRQTAVDGARRAALSFGLRRDRRRRRHRRRSEPGRRGIRRRRRCATHRAGGVRSACWDREKRPSRFAAAARADAIRSSCSGAWRR